MISQDKRRKRKLINSGWNYCCVCLSQVIIILTSCLEKKTGNKSLADRICLRGMRGARGCREAGINPCRVPLPKKPPLGSQPCRGSRWLPGETALLLLPVLSCQKHSALQETATKQKKKKHFLKDVSRWCLSCEVLLVPGRPGCSVGVAQVPSGCKSGFLVPLLLWVGASPRVRLPQATSEPTEPRSLLTTKVLVEITVSGRQMKYSPFFSLAGLHEWQVSVWN